jgi:hypothetical protein
MFQKGIESDNFYRILTFIVKVGKEAYSNLSVPAIPPSPDNPTATISCIVTVLHL